MEKCPNCGAPLDLKDPDQARVKFCQHCSSQIDLQAGSYETLTRMSQKPVFPKSGLYLGLEGSINDVRYQIVGRIRYRDIRSYGWWDEWLLLSENGQYLWLQEEDWEFVLMKKYTPTTPVDPATVGEYLDIEGSRLEVEDKSECIIQFFEGELTWKAEVGETVFYLDAWKGEETLYSIEWSEKEIMFFLGKEIPVRDIYRSFNLGEPPAEALEEDGEDGDTGFQSFTNRLLKGPAFKLSLAFGLIMLFALVVSYFVGINIYPSGQPSRSDKDSVLMGPYKLAKKGVYRIDTRMPGLNNSSQYVEFTLMDAEKEPLAQFDADFYHESGYDSEGSWSESSTSKNYYFVIDGPGDYYVEVTPEGGKTVSNLQLVLQEGVFDPKPLWVMTLSTLAYPGLVLLLYVFSHGSNDDDD